MDLAASLPVTADPVARIFIHLERATDPQAFTDPRVVPTHTYLQTALVLAQLEKVRAQAVIAVAKDLRSRGIPEARIEAWIDDAGTRLGVPASLCALARR